MSKKKKRRKSRRPRTKEARYLEKFGNHARRTATQWPDFVRDIISIRSKGNEVKATQITRDGIPPNFAFWYERNRREWAERTDEALIQNFKIRIMHAVKSVTLSNRQREDRMGRERWELWNTPIVWANKAMEWAIFEEWSRSKGIYRFHPLLIRELIDSEVPPEVPIDIFRRLPEWAPFIAVPMTYVSVMSRQAGAWSQQNDPIVDPEAEIEAPDLDGRKFLEWSGERQPVCLSPAERHQWCNSIGFWVTVERDAHWLPCAGIRRDYGAQEIRLWKDRTPSLCFYWLGRADGLGMSQYGLHHISKDFYVNNFQIPMVATTLKECVSRALSDWWESSGKSDADRIHIESIKCFLQAAINVTMFLCSKNAQHHARKSSGPRLVPDGRPKAARNWEIGERIGAALLSAQEAEDEDRRINLEREARLARLARLAEEGDEDAELELQLELEKPVRVSPRPHVRRAHYHTYWTGKGRRVPIVNWIHPTLVNVDRERRHITTNRGVETDLDWKVA